MSSTSSSQSRPAGFAKVSDVVPEHAAWRAMVALAVGFFLVMFDQGAMPLALTAIMADFDASATTVLWVMTAYLFAVAAPLLAAGRFGDRVGYKKLYLWGMGVFLVGALAAAAAPTLSTLIAARCVQGVGLSLQMPQVFAVIPRIFARERVGRALGTWGIVGSLAAIAGPLLGGTLIAQVGWRGIFVAYAVVAALGIGLAVRWVPHVELHAAAPDRATAGSDALSTFFSAAALLAVLGALQTVGRTASASAGTSNGTGSAVWGWALAALLGGAAVVLAVVFVALQKRSPDPLLPLRVFGVRNVSPGLAGIVCMGFMAATALIPVFMWLQGTRGLGAQEAGLVAVPLALVSLAVSPVAGILNDALPPRRLQAFGFGVCALSFGAAAWIMLADAPVWTMAVALGVMGLGQAFVWGTNATATFRDVPAELSGAASGVYNAARQLGAVVGTAVVSVVLALASPGWAVGVIAAVMLVGLTSSMFLRDA